MLQPRTLIDHSVLSPDSIQPYLPHPLTSLIGRDDEIVEAIRLLSDHDARLVNITGEAGVGKSRIAIEVLARMRDSDDRVHLYLRSPESLPPEQLPHLILAALASSIGTKTETIEDLANALGNTRVLVYINAIDRQVKAGPSLALLLDLLPTLTILVTSRTELHVRCERIIVIRPLAVPEIGMSVAAASQVDAVKLYMDRVQSFDPTLTLTDQNVDDVIAITRHLEGIPLALELMAGRSRLFSLASIRQRLPDALDLLVDGPADLTARSRSARASIQWTYDAIPGQWRKALRTLCIFHDAIGKDMATTLLTSDEELAPTAENAITLLSRLVSAGMIVHADPTSGVTTPERFRIRWDVQAFGREQLRELGEYESVSHRLLLAYITHFLPILKGNFAETESQLFRELDLERRDLHAVLTQAASNQETARIALPLATELWPYWNARGYLQEGQEILQNLIQAAGEEETAEFARSLHALGNIMLEMHLDAQAESLWERSITIHERCGDLAGMAGSLNNLGVLHMHAGQVDRAQHYYQRALEVRPIQGNHRFNIVTLCNLAEVLVIENKLDEAATLFREAFDIARAATFRRQMVNCMAHMMVVEYARKAENAAEEWFWAGWEVAESIDDKHGESRLRLLRGRHLFHQPDQKAAGIQETILGIRAAVESGSVRLMRQAAVVLAEIAAIHGQHRFAAQCLGASDRRVGGLNAYMAELDSDIKSRLETAIREEIGGPAFIRQIVVGSRLSVQATLESGITMLEEILEDLRERQESLELTTPLTRRELEVLACVARGLSDKEIAEELAISPRTSMTHMSNIMGKLKVKNRSAAASKGARLGLIHSD